MTQEQLPNRAFIILADSSVAAETVAKGLERICRYPDLPQPVYDELTILLERAKQLIEAFENLREWLQRRYGAALADPADGEK